MLRFMRNKLVTVARGKPDTLEVHGVLDDDIYGLELDVVYRAGDLEILAIDGKWNRWTTPECPRAVAPLQQAVGLRVEEEGFGARVHKLVGRRSCRHFANLLLECSHAAKEAAWVERWESAKQARPELDLWDWIEQSSATLPAPAAVSLSDEGRPAAQAGSRGAMPARPAPAAVASKRQGGTARPAGGTLVDLHVHTSPASPCSVLSVEDLVREARACGLDAVCLTDHNLVRSEAEVRGLCRAHDFLLLRGNEITTTQGDVLVFGFHRDVQGIVEIEDLRREVRRAGGYMIMAHPFRGFLVVGVGELGMTPESASERDAFRHVDAVEVLNGKVTARENAFAAEVARRLGLPGTGGSDAHEPGEVGRHATHFPARIRSEEDLLRALHRGEFTALSLGR